MLVPSLQTESEEHSAGGNTDVQGVAAGKTSGRTDTGAGLRQMTDAQARCGLRHKRSNQNAMLGQGGSEGTRGA